MLHANLLRVETCFKICRGQAGARAQLRLCVAPSVVAKPADGVEEDEKATNAEILQLRKYLYVSTPPGSWTIDSQLHIDFVFYILLGDCHTQ